MKEALTFDDVLLVPKKSNINSRKEISLKTRLSKNISLSIPLVSGTMDTVTESNMAITLAKMGGIGFIHRFLTIEQQANEVMKVKRAENLIIENPFTLNLNSKLKDVKFLMNENDVSGIPIIENNKLMGIITKRDILFEDDLEKNVEEIMTKDLITAPLGTSLEVAQEILNRNKIEKLPIVDENKKLHGLITSSDILKIKNYPHSSKDKKGRLMVGAAIGVKDYLERARSLLHAGADVLIIDVAHGHSENVIKVIKEIKNEFDCELIAGNVATKEGTEDLISAGADAIKVGIGNGRICVTRLVSGAGVPQLTALIDCYEVASKYNIPIIADGGTGGLSGNIVKCLAAGASTVMLHGTLAGTEESPGVVIRKNGGKYKLYRGMASVTANIAKKEVDKKSLIDQDEIDEITAEGVESLVPYKGKASEIIKQLLGGVKSGLNYIGAKNFEELKKNAEFIRVTESGIKESKPHHVEVI